MSYKVTNTRKKGNMSLMELSSYTISNAYQYCMVYSVSQCTITNTVHVPIFSDPLCEDYRTFVSSVYRAVSKITTQKCYVGRVRDVKICVTDPQLLNHVLQELLSLSTEGKN